MSAGFSFSVVVIEGRRAALGRLRGARVSGGLPLPLRATGRSGVSGMLSSSGLRGGGALRRFLGGSSRRARVRGTGGTVGRERAGARPGARVSERSSSTPSTPPTSSRRRVGFAPAASRQRYPAVRGSRTMAASKCTGRATPSPTFSAMRAARSTATSIALVGSSFAIFSALIRSISRTPRWVSTRDVSSSDLNITSSAYAVVGRCFRRSAVRRALAIRPLRVPVIVAMLPPPPPAIPGPIRGAKFSAWNVGEYRGGVPVDDEPTP